MYFEQTIAFSIAAQNYRRLPGQGMPKVVMYHTNNAITHLRRRLLAGDTSDLVILTIMQQGSIQHMSGDNEMFGVHVRAVEDLVALRGGLLNLGWDGYVASRVRQVMAAWKMMQKKPQEERIGTIEGVSQGKFTYPQHPFPPTLSHKITRFPIGFRESALRNELSLQFIDYLDVTLQWVRDEDSIMRLKRPVQHEILSIRLSFVERLLATAILAYSNFLERTKRSRQNKVGEQTVQSQVRLLSVQEKVTNCDDDLLYWVCLMLRATTSEGTESWGWANAFLCPISVSRQEEEKLERMFLPVPTTRINEIWAEESISPHSQASQSTSTDSNGAL